jgi:hypothetical protein
MITGRRIFIFTITIATLVFLASPAGATVVLSDESFSPNAPLIVGGQQHMTAKFAILPSGSTTFIKGHELQMQTGLVNAQWNIQVIVDGQNAARQTASGTAAFVNGALLTYPTSRDVSLVVTIDATVPQTNGNQIMVLQLEDLDNAENVVPGSVITISQPVAALVSTSGQTAFPTHTHPLVTQSPSRTASPGFSMPAIIIALGAIGIIWIRCIK